MPKPKESCSFVNLKKYHKTVLITILAQLVTIYVLYFCPKKFAVANVSPIYDIGGLGAVFYQISVYITTYFLPTAPLTRS